MKKLNTREVATKPDGQAQLFHAPQCWELNLQRKKQKHQSLDFLPSTPDLYQSTDSTHLAQHQLLRPVLDAYADRSIFIFSVKWYPVSLNLSKWHVSIKREGPTQPTSDFSLEWLETIISYSLDSVRGLGRWRAGKMAQSVKEALVVWVQGPKFRYLECT